MAGSEFDHGSLEALVNRMIRVEGLPRNDDLDLKIAVLGLALEKLQRLRRSTTQPIEFEKFEQCRLVVDGDRIVLTAPGEFRRMGTGTPPIQLQAPLLLFLLLHHRERYSVLDIIRLFVERIWDELTDLDFKKTKTGVTRCFTNTRFAAGTLRGYGLLKYTQREAFKTWELSLSGFLVAARILKQRTAAKRPWGMDTRCPDSGLDLSSEIREARNELASFDAFAKCLASICTPNADVFKTFRPALEKAFQLLKGYWNVLNDLSKSRRERQAASLECINRLEREGISDDFYADFSRCVHIDELLARVFE